MSDLQRFQVSYNLKSVPEVQEYLNVCFDNAKQHGDLKDLYRRRSVVSPTVPHNDNDALPAFSLNLDSRSLTRSNLSETYDNSSAGQPAPSHNHIHNKQRHHDYDFLFALYIARYHGFFWDRYTRNGTVLNSLHVTHCKIH